MLTNVIGRPEDISGRPQDFSSTDWVFGGAVTIGETYLVDESWFIDLNQGRRGLDTLGYVALLAGGLTLFPSITAVVGSGFGFLTIVLARLIIKEEVKLAQWIAVMVSFGGIAWLAYGQ
jgi:hypothetical protein